MKKTVAFFSLLITCVALFAQSGTTFPYQAVVRNSQNQLIKDSTFAIGVEVYQGADLKFSETQSVTTNANGQFTMNIGGGTAGTGSLNDVADWSVAKFKITYHLGDGDVVSEQLVHPVPYALQAANAVGGNFLTSDSAVITAMQSDIAALQAATADNITKNNLCSSIKDNCTNVALKNEANTFSGNNTFTGNNDFTAGTTTVASGFTFGTTTAANCNNVAVNACDLLAVFDSLVKRMNDIEQNLYKKIDSLKNILDEPIPCTVTRKNANEKGTGATGISAVKDHQDNWYKVVQIGTQCWMAENLRATTEPTAPDVSILRSSCSETSGSAPYAYYSLCNEDTAAKYGCLYNFPAVMNGHAPLTNATKHRGICPEGWHVPTDAEWKTLEKCCLMEDDGITPITDNTLNNYGDGFRGKGAGKFTGGSDWKDADGATVPGNYAYAERNFTGFSALPAGNNHSNELGYYVYFWSATKSGGSGDDIMIYYRTFGYKEEGVKRNGSTKYAVHSLRCVRD